MAGRSVMHSNRPDNPQAWPAAVERSGYVELIGRKTDVVTYWMMFLLPAWISVAVSARPQMRDMDLELSWLVAAILLIIVIGLRHQVGGDWANYEQNYFDMLWAPAQALLEKTDPGYYLLNWLSGKVQGGVYLVNFVCGLIFSFGLVFFCRKQPRPWLALAVAMPYMVTVVAMGYTRQGVALGLVLAGLAWLARGHNFMFVLMATLAATFHKSALVLIPLSILATPRGRLWNAFWVGITAALLYYSLLADSVEGLVKNYIEAQYQSEGAAIRVAMNTLPALIMLVFFRRFQWTTAERNLWVMLALFSLGTVGGLFASQSSTAVDRLALYLIPLQLYVFARLPDILGRGRSQRFWVVMVLIYYATVLFVWLNYAHHAVYWKPYKSWLFL